MLFALCQLVGGMILTIGIIPQIHQIIKTKSVKDLNLKSSVMVLIGIILMEIYAISLFISGFGIPFFITNTFSLLLQLITVFLIIKYKVTK